MPKAPPIEVRLIGRDELSSKLARFSQRVNAVGRTLTTHLTLPLTIVGGAMGRVAYNYSRGMGKIASLVPGDTKFVNEMGEEIQKMSLKTGKSLQELQDNMYWTLSSFQKNKHLFKQFEIGTKTAVAGIAEAGPVIQLLQQITKAYGDTSEEALKRAADLSLMTVRLGVTDYPALAMSMGKVIAPAKQLNLSQEEMFATMSALSGVTGDTAEVATQVSGLLTAFLKSTPAMAKRVKEINKIYKENYKSAYDMVRGVGLSEFLKRLNIVTGGTKKSREIIKSLGYESLKQMKNELGFAGAMDKLANSTELVGSEFAKLVPRKRAMLAAFALLGGLSEKFESDYKQMEEASKHTGKYLEETYKEVTEGAGKSAHDVEKLRAKFEVMSLTVGNKLLPVVIKLTTALDPLINAITKATDEQVLGAIKLAAYAAAAGPVLRGVGGLIGGFTKLRGGIMAANAAATAATGTLGTLGKVGLWAGGAIGAFGAGYLGGSILNETIIEPHSGAQAKKFSDVQRRREEIEGKFKTLTTKEKMAAIRELETGKETAKSSLYSAENVAGAVASVFTDVDTPIERLNKELKENNALQKRLIESVQRDIKESQEVKVTFENVPQGTKIEEKKTKRGKIMQ